MPRTQSQRDELDRRLDALDADEMAPGEPWQIIRERPFPR